MWSLCGSSVDTRPAGTPHMVCLACWVGAALWQQWPPISSIFTIASSFTHTHIPSNPQPQTLGDRGGRGRGRGRHKGTGGGRGGREAREMEKGGSEIGVRGERGRGREGWCEKELHTSTRTHTNNENRREGRERERGKWERGVKGRES